MTFEAFLIINNAFFGLNFIIIARLEYLHAVYVRGQRLLEGDAYFPSTFPNAAFVRGVALKRGTTVTRQVNRQ